MPIEQKGLGPLSLPPPAAAPTLRPQSRAPHSLTPRPTQPHPLVGAGVSRRKGGGANGRARLFPRNQGGLPGGGALELGFVGWAGACQAHREGVL